MLILTILLYTISYLKYNSILCILYIFKINFFCELQFEMCILCSIIIEQKIIITPAK